MTLKKFQELESYHRKKQARLLISGKGVQRHTSHGYWASATPLSVYELFKKYKLDKSSKFLDLGSGDGIVVAIASLFASAVGIEVDSELCKESENMRDKFKLSFTIKNKDYMEEDFSSYDFIFIHPDNYFYKLEKKITEEFKGIMIVCGMIFKPLILPSLETVNVAGVDYAIYIVE